VTSIQVKAISTHISMVSLYAFFLLDSLRMTLPCRNMESLTLFVSCILRFLFYFILFYFI